MAIILRNCIYKKTKLLATKLAKAVPVRQKLFHVEQFRRRSRKPMLIPACSEETEAFCTAENREIASENVPRGTIFRAIERCRQQENIRTEP
jgi:hypothetical protein